MIRMFLSILRGFGYAFRGIWRTLKEERNFRIHLAAVFFVGWFALIYEASASQWIVLCLLFGGVLALELVNTAVENAVDLVTDQYSPFAEKAKDAAAGAVLLGAVVSAVVAVFLFRDPVHWELVLSKIQSPVRILCFAVFAVLALFFVRGRASDSKK